MGRVDPVWSGAEDKGQGLGGGLVPQERETVGRHGGQAVGSQRPVRCMHRLHPLLRHGGGRSGAPPTMAQEGILLRTKLNPGRVSSQPCWGLLAWGQPHFEEWSPKPSWGPCSQGFSAPGAAQVVSAHSGCGLPPWEALAGGYFPGPCGLSGHVTPSGQ